MDPESERELVVWQIAAGDSTRRYADGFLKHGVAPPWSWLAWKMDRGTRLTKILKVPCVRQFARAVRYRRRASAAERDEQG